MGKDIGFLQSSNSLKQAKTRLVNNFLKAGNPMPCHYKIIITKALLLAL